jgi:hypothetical protein
LPLKIKGFCSAEQICPPRLESKRNHPKVRVGQDGFYFENRDHFQIKKVGGFPNKPRDFVALNKFSRPDWKVRKTIPKCGSGRMVSVLI